MVTKVDPHELVERHGRTYAAEAGITLRDKPAPLFQLLVLTVLSSTRISADIAARAAHELFKEGWRTPQRMKDSTWQQRVDALGRGGYARYDESTASSLDQVCDQVLERYGGDLRRIRPGKDGSVRDLEQSLRGFQRIGPTGAAIFCREAQAVWPELEPYFDRLALSSAEKLGYGTDPTRLGRLAPDGDVATFAAALVRQRLSGRS